MDNNVSFDFQALLDAMVYQSAPDDVKPLLNLLSKYGIKGIQAMTFLSELIAIVNAMKPEDKDDE